MGELRIANWDKYQSKRKDRDSTPWIKFHRRALMSPTWHQMVDSERGQFLSLLLLADADGVLATDDATILQRMAGMSEPIDIQRFISLGLLDGNQLATARQPSVTPEKEREVEREREVEKEQITRAREFDVFWNAYPHKVGKADALKAFKTARKKTDLSVIMDGLHRYIRDKPDDRNWCNPGTWMRQERWLDEPAPPVNGTGPPKTRTQEATERLLQRHGVFDERTDAIRNG